MKKKNILVMTLVLSALLLASSFNGIATNPNPSGLAGSLEVEKKVYNPDESLWVDSIDAEKGDTLQFKITVTYYNITDPAHAHYAENIIVRDTLPACFEYEVGSADPFEPTVDTVHNKLTWDFTGLETLNDGETLIIIFNATIGECCGVQINNAAASAYEHCTGQTITDQDSATINVICPQPGIQVQKKVWDKKQLKWVEQAYSKPDTTTRFNITVYNSGDCDLFDVYVNDTLPIGLDYANAATITPTAINGKHITWYFPGPFAAGAKIYIEFDVTVTDTTPGHILVNIVNVVGQNQDCCSPKIVTDSDTAKVKVNGMLVIKQVRDQTGQWVDSIYAEVGDTVRFKITIYYYGDYTLYDIHVEDVLPCCLEYANSANPVETDIDGQTIIWDLTGALSDGGYTTIEFNAKIKENNCQDCINLARVTANECSGDILIKEDTAIVHVICGVAADAGGPYEGEINEVITITGSATGGTPPYTYEWDMDNDGEYDDETGSEITWSWSIPGTYTIWLKATDDNGFEDEAYATVTITANTNNAPNKPSISGATSGLRVNVKYEYDIAATDPNNDKVYYYVDWGDGSSENWIGPYNSSAVITVNHSWSGYSTSYNIRVKAKDTYGAESSWATLTVATPKSKTKHMLLTRLLEKFPAFENFLRVLEQILAR